MESSSANSSKKDSDECSEKLTKGDSESTHGVSAVIQTSAKNLTHDLEEANIAVDNSKNLEFVNEEHESNIVVHEVLNKLIYEVSSAKENEDDTKQTTQENINTGTFSKRTENFGNYEVFLAKRNEEHSKETTQENINVGKFSKCIDSFTKTLKNLSVIMAYPAKNRPRQHFIAQPPTNQPLGGRPPPRMPAPPPYYTPPTPRRPEPPSERPQNAPRRPGSYSVQPEPAPANVRDTAQPGPQGAAQSTSQAITQGTPQRTAQGPAPGSPQRNVPSPVPSSPQGIPEGYSRRPDTLVFIDPHPMYSLYPYYMPSSLHNSVIWAQFPSKIPASAPGCLAHLVVVDSVYVLKLCFYDYFANLEDFFLVQNKNGECLYLVYRSVNYDDLAFWDSYDNCRLHVMDMYDNEVIFMNRISGGSSCCSYASEMEVYAPPESPAGVISKKYNCFRDEYAILNPDGNQLFRIKGPCCLESCCCLSGFDYVVQALDQDQTQVGFIRQEVGYNSFLSSDFFAVAFPIDMDVRMKAVFLGLIYC